MQRIFTLALFATLSLSVITPRLNAQNPGDTIVVNTLNFSSETRDTMITFPDLSGVSIEKILMHYGMRCHDAAINTTGGNGIACGEWDYSCNTYITDSTRTDSVAATHPDHIISGFSGTTFNYTTSETYTYYQSIQEEITYTNVISEVQTEIGAGAVSSAFPFDNASESSKTQYLLTAAEIASGPVGAGDITGLAFDMDAAGDDITNLRIRIKQTDEMELDPLKPELDGYTTVYYLDSDFPNPTERYFYFSQPFAWDGTSNIIVELSFNNTTGTGSSALSETIAGHGISSNAEDYALDFGGNNSITVANDFPSISDEITISCWVYGAEELPVNTSAFEGVDANNNRQVNVHLPWSNGRVYWDCGGDGGSYDRIDKEANVEDIKGQWNHWAFTKNATSGIMRIYLNGGLWHTGSGKTNPIDLKSLRLGSSITSSNGYLGKIDEFRVWNIALSSSQVRDYMYTSVDASHPNYDNLLLYYNFNEGNGSVANDAMAAHEGTLVNEPLWREKTGKGIMMDFEPLSTRPNFKVLQGEYESTIVETVLLDSLVNGSNTVTAYGLDGTDIEELNTNVYYEAGDMPIYNEGGGFVGSINVPTENTIEISDLNYFAKYPSRFEIMSFVTPYGIGLDMTEAGKFWTFDVTDFGPILIGNKRLSLDKGGQWQEELDIQFLFIVGTPPSEVLDIQQIWKNASRSYNSISSDQFFPPRDVMTNPAGERFKVRSAITGHGQAGEFVPRTHYIDIDGGNNEFSWEVWKECAENPLYPQGGTWIYDRAGWCPGMATDVHEADITEHLIPGETVNIDYGIVTASGDTRYIVNHQLVTYGEANFENDASLLEVRKPSNRFEFDRFGTICHNPEVVIQNTGNQLLTSVTINYWINDATTPLTYEWTGILAMMQTAVVELPSPNVLWEGVNPDNNVFHASVSNPNGTADEYELNNAYHSTFNIPTVIPNDFIVIFKTNNVPGENLYEVRDRNGEIVLSRDNMAANTIYNDTLQLTPGCYSFRVYDGGDDGIDFWANNDGIGYVRFKEVNGPVLEWFEPDFGDGINFEFTVEWPLSYEDIKDVLHFEAYPNPTKDQLNIALSGFDTNVDIRVFNSLGQMVLSKNLQTTTDKTLAKLDMETLQSGVYVVQATDGTRTSTQKVVKE